VPRETVRLHPAIDLLTLEPEPLSGSRTSQPVNHGSAFRDSARQAACTLDIRRRNVSPFFQIFSVMAAILRASVSRAISGRMSFAQQSQIKFPHTPSRTLAAVAVLLNRFFIS